MPKEKRARKHLLRMMVFFVFFGVGRPALPFCGMDPVAGKDGISVPRPSEKGLLQAPFQKKSKPSRLKDPFKPFILEPEPVAGGKAGKPRTYLESVPLSQLELIAVVVAPEDRWAMLRDAKGIGYIVKPGTPVGIDGGSVCRIRPGEIVIRCIDRNSEGEMIKRDTVKRPLQ